jgi:hypothetical protein
MIFSDPQLNQAVHTGGRFMHEGGIANPYSGIGRWGVSGASQRWFELPSVT